MTPTALELRLWKALNVEPVPLYRSVRARFEAVHGFHTARLTAAARALMALGIVPDMEMDDGND